MAFALNCIYLLMCCSLSLIFLDHKHTVKSHEHLSGKLSEYGLMVPFSTDSHGRYISHVVSVSGAWASAATGESESEGADAGGGAGASSSPGPGKRRVARSVPDTPSITSGAGQHLFFNVTVFGKELHLRLKANRRLVAPGAFVEWQEDFEEKAKERLHGDCVFTGDISNMPEATVAISNCDGLVSQ
ncbi:unnamed protein product [Oncorhynchus mykiss]|uniref:Peptidase M12B propeptide domain-containing protein n=1 Tax=Oncorhynchus mykiss TaxID=8022 RepID=A0A060YXR4_ONCMY|nr:unnamed protein product [Oncorhynchus mykiss]